VLTHTSHRGVHCLAVLLLCPFVGIVAIAQQPEAAATLAFLEGPTVDRDGNVYFVEMTTPRIMKLGADGVLTTYRDKSNNANGLVIDAEGRLIACEAPQSRTATA
jgi:sugar lactone lactonase YvrE